MKHMDNWLRRSIRFAAALGLCALLGACAGTRGGGTPGGDPPEGGDDPGTTDVPITPRVYEVSRITQVRPESRWVVLRSERAVVPGTQWRVMRGSRQVALVETPVNGRSEHPYYIADIVEGAPRIDDEVYPK